MKEQRSIGKQRQWVQRIRWDAYTVSVIPPERERVTPAEPIEGMARLFDAGPLVWESVCSHCGLTLGRHEYTEDQAYRVTHLNPSLRLRPGRHPNGLRYFTPDPRPASGRTPRRRDSPTQIAGMVFVECPRCSTAQSVFGTAIKRAFPPLP